MVIPDLNDSSVATNRENPAPYIDRIFANVIDFLILVPVISLFTSGITNDIRWAIFNQHPSEIYFTLLQYGFISFCLFLLYEILFLYFHSATPGHRFLYLKLVPEKGEVISIFSIFFRTLFKFQSLLVVGIPFVEIVLRRDRSTFYDRLSLTRIVSLRMPKADEIHPEFRKIILRWAHSSIILIFVFVALGFYQTVNHTNGSMNSLKKVSPTCQDSLGQYLKSYLSKIKETENLNCARTVVERSFENRKSEKSLNYLAQYVVSPNDELKESYRIKYCADRPNKPLCRDDWKSDFEGFRPDEEDVVNLLVEMNASLAKNDHSAIFTILDLLYTHLDWNKNLELYYLTSYIHLNEKQMGRGPASEKGDRRQWNSMKTRFLKRMSTVE